VSAEEVALAADQSLLRPYVPRLVVDWLRTAPEQTWREVDGSLAFVDISGFTKLTERLARKGRIGAEEMSDTLSATFSALLTVAYEDGAGLVKWGGDAVLLLFEGDDHAAHAARAAFRMRAALRNLGQRQTTAGNVVLRMSVGIHSGTFHFFLVGDPALHRELLVSGPAASITAEVEGLASAGQIGLSASAAALLPKRLSRLVDDKWSVLSSEPNIAPMRAPFPPDIAGLDVGATLSEPIRRHLLAGGGEPEHRNIAVGFVQFSGTDALLAEHGPQVLADALDQCMRTVQTACDRHGVTFFETDINRDGGKVMLVAGAPTTSGNNEERMLLAARHILDRPGPLPVRIGVNSGPVFTGDFGPSFRRTYSVKGDAINLAARVMGKAAPGQLLATQAALAGSAATFDAEPLPPFLVKGKAKPVAAASVGPAHGGPRPGAADVAEDALVGREAEMTALRGALDQARSRQGLLLQLVGEPGIGKSRLVEELRRDADDVTVLFTACDEYESATAYFPFRSLLRDVAGIPVGSSPADVLERLVHRVAPNHPDLVPWLPLLGVPMDVPLVDSAQTSALGEQFRKARVEDVTVQFLAATLPTPTLLVVDDVHLMDESSAELMHKLSVSVSGCPWLVLVTRRDQLAGYVPDGDDPTMVTVRPAPLDAEMAMSLVGLSSDDAPLPPHQAAAIAERAGGNPLFLRSLVAAARAGNAGDPAAPLPDRIEDVINSQIDRLPTAERTLLRFASVLGVSFPESQLRTLMAGEQLPTGRESLLRLGQFLEVAGHGRFRFRHALLRDSAYEGLSYRRRQLLHGRVGETLETSAPNPDDEAELLSMHYLHAGRHDKAWYYARVAGDRSRAKYAYVEAAEFYTRAIDAARRLHGVAELDFASVYENLGDSVARLGGYAQARLCYRSARRHRNDDPVASAGLLLKEALQVSRQGKKSLALRLLTVGLNLLGGREDAAALAQRSKLEAIYSFTKYDQGAYPAARAWGLRAEDHALAAHDDAALAEAYVGLQAVAAWSGYGKGEPYGERALALYEKLGDRLQAAHVLNNTAAGAFFEGRWSDALAMFEQAHREYQAAGDMVGAATAQFNVADIEWRQRRYGDAEARLRDVRRTARGLGEPELVAFAERELGRTLVLSGRPEEGLPFLQTALAEFVAEGANYEQLVTESAMVEYLLHTGKVDEARERCDAAMLRAQSSDAATLLPTFSRLRAEALLATGEPALAEGELSRTLDNLDEQGAHERGFLLLDLTQARSALGAADVIDLRDRAHLELGRLGVVVDQSD
jgi:class 3 adenylate cyclase/tetratricopeptide (TPR) repeat protein